MADIKAGDTVKAGAFLLFTYGEYSSYGIIGLYRAKIDFVVPGKKPLWGGRDEPDITAVSANPALVEEVAYDEMHRDG